MMYYLHAIHEYPGKVCKRCITSCLLVCKKTCSLVTNFKFCRQIKNQITSRYIHHKEQIHSNITIDRYPLCILSNLALFLPTVSYLALFSFLLHISVIFDNYIRPSDPKRAAVRSCQANKSTHKYRMCAKGKLKLYQLKSSLETP